MKVKVTADGFFDGVLYRAGQEFVAPKDAKATWFSPVEEPEAAQPKKPPRDKPTDLA